MKRMVSGDFQDVFNFLYLFYSGLRPIEVSSFNPFFATKLLERFEKLVVDIYLISLDAWMPRSYNSVRLHSNISTTENL